MTNWFSLFSISGIEKLKSALNNNCFFSVELLAWKLSIVSEILFQAFSLSFRWDWV
jgi:hypothetical protein